MSKHFVGFLTEGRGYSEGVAHTAENAEGVHGVDESADLRSYIGPVWQRKWLILVVVLVATVATYIFYDNKPRVYQSGAQLFVGTSTIDSVLYGFTSGRDDRYVQNQVILMQSQQSREAARNLLRQELGPQAQPGPVVVTAAAGTDFIKIVATGSTPELAAETANATAGGYIEARSDENRDRAKRARELAERELATLPAGQAYVDRRTALRTEVQRFKVIESAPAGDAAVVERAEPQGRPIAPKPIKNARFAFVLSLLAGIGLAFAIERFDRRFKRVEDIASGYGSTLLAAVPHQDEPTPFRDGKNEMGPQLKETFRGLRTNLQLAALDVPLKVLMVTSAVPGEGKSTTVRNLALAYREWGLRVAVVDADLRRATLQKIFHVEPEFGLTDVLTGAVTLREAVIDVPVTLRGLHTLARIKDQAGNTNGHGSGNPMGRLSLLASGPVPANPQAVLATKQVNHVIEELRINFDIVIVDTPPVLAVSDAIPLVAESDGVVVVARVNETTREAAKRLTDVLRRSKGNLIGVVANDIPQLELRGGAYTYYGYRYGYGYGLSRRARKKQDQEVETLVAAPE
jgi:Mrp family chromosome partitioning ATPase/capsular polysaccharide biosynthesis protein